VHYEVREKISNFQCHDDLLNFASSITILLNYEVDDVVNIKCCKPNENVCHGREGSKDDFFYFYSHVIVDSHVTFPLDGMIMDLLQILNVAPTQLHPNSWVAMQAF